MAMRWSEEHSIGVDRGGDVPVGVQLIWALRNAIHSGRLGPGDQLPPLRQLADELGVNPNTLRAAYARLEADGLIDTRHGRGTFVTAASESEALNRVAADAARAAMDAGVDRRALAAALYLGAGDVEDEESAARRRLHQEIAALERIVALMKPPPVVGRQSGQGPRVLGLDELEAVRDQLVAAISAADAPEPEPDATARKPAPSGLAARRAAPQQ